LSPALRWVYDARMFRWLICLAVIAAAVIGYNAGLSRVTALTLISIGCVLVAAGLGLSLIKGRFKGGKQ